MKERCIVCEQYFMNTWSLSQHISLCHGGSLGPAFLKACDEAKACFCGVRFLFTINHHKPVTHLGDVISRSLELRFLEGKLNPRPSPDSPEWTRNIDEIVAAHMALALDEGGRPCLS